MIEYEYRTLRENNGETTNFDLNKLGAEGWELVAVDPNNGDGGVSYSIYIFKRPKLVPLK